MIIAPIAGHISDRMDSRYISSAGMVFTSIGLFLLGTLKEDTNLAYLILYTAIIGFGIGIFQTPNNSAIMGSVPHERRGTASSMIATMRNLGMVLGVSLSGTLFSARQIYLTKVFSQKGIDGIQLKNASFTGAMKTTFIVGSALAAIAIFISLIRGPLNTKTRKTL
jgi:MFS family permease